MIWHMARHLKSTQKSAEVRSLLHRLNGSDPGAAWAEFIDHYSPVILKLVNQFEYEQGRRDECFLFVCENLCSNGFRRLLKFNTRGKASFGTWLSSVVFNLCVDWHRREFGRSTLLPAISALSEFDQSVYRVCFEQGMDKRSGLNFLEEDFPGLDGQMLSESMARIHQVLTPRQRWKLVAKKALGPRSQVRTDEAEAQSGAFEGPENEARRKEAELLIKNALGRLPRDQRLAVVLRYIQGMTLREVAEILGLADPFRARRLIQAALEQLASEIPVDIGSKRR